MHRVLSLSICNLMSVGHWMTFDLNVYECARREAICIESRLFNYKLSYYGLPVGVRSRDDVYPRTDIVIEEIGAQFVKKVVRS